MVDWTVSKFLKQAEQFFELNDNKPTSSWNTPVKISLLVFDIGYKQNNVNHTQSKSFLYCGLFW